MKTFFIKSDVDETIERINRLTPDTKGNWGVMNVEQMLAHCTVAVEAGTGDRFVSRTLMGRLIGRFFKSMATNNKSFGKGSPTHPDYKVNITLGFEPEKEKLIDIISRFYEGGKQGVTENPHAFFGYLTPTEWGALLYKHTDHHLRQFGV